MFTDVNRELLLKQQRRRQQERQNNNLFCTCITFFVHFFAVDARLYYVKLPKLAFYEGRESKETTCFFFFLT